MAAAIRFYLDENLSVAIADQLRRRGIEVVTVRDLNLLGDSDQNHLRRSTQMGYVLCTYDADYIDLVASGVEHAGIVKGQAEKQGIGEWVKSLELIHTIYTVEDMLGHVEYL